MAIDAVVATEAVDAVVAKAAAEGVGSVGAVEGLRGCGRAVGWEIGIEVIGCESSRCRVLEDGQNGWST